MRYMRLIRIALAALLAPLLLFDFVLGYRLWRRGFPKSPIKSPIVIGEGPAQRIVFKPIAFTPFDWFILALILALLAALHIASAYTVW
jgi:Sec-independent protein secretion pathway component TatC